MDYWTESMQQESALFKEVFQDLNKVMPEKTKSFWDDATMHKLKNMFKYTFDVGIAEVDRILSSNSKSEKNIEPDLLNADQYFPLRMMTSEKISTTPSGIFNNASK